MPNWSFVITLSKHFNSTDLFNVIKNMICIYFVITYSLVNVVQMTIKNYESKLKNYVAKNVLMMFNFKSLLYIWSLYNKESIIFLNFIIKLYCLIYINCSTFLIISTWRWVCLLQHCIVLWFELFLGIKPKLYKLIKPKLWSLKVKR